MLILILLFAGMTALAQEPQVYAEKPTVKLRIVCAPDNVMENGENFCDRSVQPIIAYLQKWYTLDSEGTEISAAITTTRKREIIIRGGKRFWEEGTRVSLLIKQNGAEVLCLYSHFHSDPTLIGTAIVDTVGNMDKILSAKFQKELAKKKLQHPSVQLTAQRAP